MRELTMQDLELVSGGDGSEVEPCPKFVKFMNKADEKKKPEQADKFRMKALALDCAPDQDAT